jgi:hypothetical protein
MLRGIGMASDKTEVIPEAGMTTPHLRLGNGGLPPHQGHPEMEAYLIKDTQNLLPQ